MYWRGNDSAGIFHFYEAWLDAADMGTLLSIGGIEDVSGIASVHAVARFRDSTAIPYDAKLVLSALRTRWLGNSPSDIRCKATLRRSRWNVSGQLGDGNAFSGSGTIGQNGKAGGRINLTLGNFIRNSFGLWADNQDLMQSCSKAAGREVTHQDTASAVIIEKLVSELEQTHKLRKV